MEAIRFHGGMRANIPRFRPGQDSTIAHFFALEMLLLPKEYYIYIVKGVMCLHPPTSTIQLYSEKQIEH